MRIDSSSNIRTIRRSGTGLLLPLPRGLEVSSGVVSRADTARRGLGAAFGGAGSSDGGGWRLGLSATGTVDVSFSPAVRRGDVIDPCVRPRPNNAGGGDWPRGETCGTSPLLEVDGMLDIFCGLLLPRALADPTDTDADAAGGVLLLPAERGDTGRGDDAVVFFSGAADSSRASGLRATGGMMLVDESSRPLGARMEKGSDVEWTVMRGQTSPSRSEKV